MKNLALTALIIVLLCSFILAFTIISENKNNISSSTPEIITYTIKEYNNRIGIFKNNSTEPFQIIDVPISNLPLADIELLNKGITVKNNIDLQKIIEDYTG